MPSPTPAPDLRAYGAANWRALGTYVQLVVAGGDKLEAARAVAVRVLSEVDRACSRFRSDSDLTRANANAGSWTQVDPLLAAAVTAAVRAAEQTDGLVDPTLGRSLAAVGYDRDIAAVQAQPGPAGIPLPALPGAWSRIGIDPTGGVLVPEGVALDLGATGKAFTSDLIAASIVREVGAPCVISVGGDVAVGIAAEGPVPWRIAISELPEAEPRRDGPASGRRPGDLHDNGPAVASRQRDDPPSPRSRHRVSGDHELACREHRGIHLHRREHREHGGDSARGRGTDLAGSVRRHRPPRRHLR